MRLAWFALATIVPFGASAQDVTVWYDPALKETDNTTALIDAVGSCVSNSPVWLSRYKPVRNDNKKSGEIVRSCVGRATTSSYRVPNWILAGSIARGYYIKRFSVAPVANEAPLFWPFPETVEKNAANFLFFDCVLKSDPVRADQLVRSSGGSPEEEGLNDAVVAASRSCVSPERKKIGKQGLKFGLADALFRRSLPASELVATSSGGAE